MDTKDRAVARSYFTQIIYTDFSSPGGGNPTEIPADELVSAWQKNLYAGRKSFHIRGNHVITINNNTATDYSKSYAINAIDEGAVTGVSE